MIPVVIDASAGAEIVTDTARGRALLRLLPSDVEGWVPQHFYAEVLGVLRHQSIFAKILTEEQAYVALGRLRRWHLRQAAVPPLLEAAWELRHNMRAADAMYVALGAVFLSDDHKLLNVPTFPPSIGVLRLPSAEPRGTGRRTGLIRDASLCDHMDRGDPDQQLTGNAVSPAHLLRSIRAQVAPADDRRPSQEVVGVLGDGDRAADQHKGEGRRLVVKGHGHARIALERPALARARSRVEHQIITVEGHPDGCDVRRSVTAQSAQLRGSCRQGGDELPPPRVTRDRQRPSAAERR